MVHCINLPLSDLLGINRYIRSISPARIEEWKNDSCFQLQLTVNNVEHLPRGEINAKRLDNGDGETSLKGGVVE